MARGALSIRCCEGCDLCFKSQATCGTTVGLFALLTACLRFQHRTMGIR